MVKRFIKKLKEINLKKIIPKKNTRDIEELFNEGQIFKASDRELDKALKKIIGKNNGSTETMEIVRAITILSIKSSRETISVNKINVFLSLIIILISVVSYKLLEKQTDYARVQSIPAIIDQSRSKKNAIEYCEKNPDSSDSGMFYIDDGIPAPCSVILKKYKK